MTGAAQIIRPELGDTPNFEIREIGRYDWKDGLAVRAPNWLGDAVMTFPAMLQLKLLLPEKCGLFVICPKGFVPLYRSMPIVDLVIGLENAHSFPSRAEFGSMRRLNAGVGVVFNNSFRDVLTMRLAGIRPVFGASARCRSILLERAFDFPPRKDRELNKPHHAAKYLSMAYAVGAPRWNGVFPEIKVQLPKEEYSDTLRSALSMNKLMAVAAGAAYGDAKRWSAAKFREVCRWWIESMGGSVAILGTSKEKDVAAELAQGLPPEKTLDLSGRTSMEELILLLQHSGMCVANDSGIMHLAAALGCPGVAVFGSTDPAATSPVSSKWRIVFDKKECAPCFKRICPDGSKKCLDIAPSAVIAAARELCAAK